MRRMNCNFWIHACLIAYKASWSRRIPAGSGLEISFCPRRARQGQVLRLDITSWLRFVLLIYSRPMSRYLVDRKFVSDSLFWNRPIRKYKNSPISVTFLSKKNQTILSASLLNSLFKISMIVTSHTRNRTIPNNKIKAVKRANVSTTFRSIGGIQLYFLFSARLAVSGAHGYNSTDELKNQGKTHEKRIKIGIRESLIFHL